MRCGKVAFNGGNCKLKAGHKGTHKGALEEVKPAPVIREYLPAYEERRRNSTFSVQAHDLCPRYRAK